MLSCGGVHSNPCAKAASAGRRIPIALPAGFSTTRSCPSLTAAMANFATSTGTGLAVAFQAVISATELKAGIAVLPSGVLTATMAKSALLSTISPCAPTPLSPSSASSGISSRDCDRAVNKAALSNARFRTSARTFGVEPSSCDQLFCENYRPSQGTPAES